MSDPRDLFINPHHDGGPPECPLWLRPFAKWLINRIGRERLPTILKKILGVVELPGKLTFQSMPEFPEYRECGVFTILSANLWHDWPRYSLLMERLESFVKLVNQEKVDLVLIQEIPRIGDFKGDSWLSRKLDMGFVYSRVNGSQQIGFEEGLGIFSRFELNQKPFLKQVSRGCNPFVRRLVLGAAICTPCGEILAFSVHLGLLRSKNNVQVHDLQHWVTRIAQGRTVFVGGDFNTTEKSPQIRRISSHWLDTYRMINYEGNSETHEIHLPWGLPAIKHRLDYIFMKPGNTNWKIVDSLHIYTPNGPHSDHRAVLTRIVPL